MYGELLGNEKLGDPNEGVDFFENTLKKYFLKGATDVYLYRLARRHNTEFPISKSEVLQCLCFPCI